MASSAPFDSKGAILVGEAPDGSLLQIQTNASGNVMVETSGISAVAITGAGSRITGDDAAHSVTIPAGTTRVILIAEGGTIRFALSGTASATSTLLATAGGSPIGIDTDSASTLSVYVPTLATANLTFTARR